MSPRTVTPAKAQEMLDGTTPGPWRVYGNAVSEDALSDAWTISHDGDDLAELHADDRPEHGSESDESVAALCEADADLMAAAPDLAATVASEPERIAAAVAAERTRVAHVLARLGVQDYGGDALAALESWADEEHARCLAATDEHNAAVAKAVAAERAAIVARLAAEAARLRPNWNAASDHHADALLAMADTLAAEVTK